MMINDVFGFLLDGVVLVVVYLCYIIPASFIIWMAVDAAKQDKFFAYPNNYNYYVTYYKNTLQHGGISLEEMVIPFAVLSSK